ncbi:hydroxyproline O-galactosyltransferase HPGT1-like isoform X3 [Pistacia vera]|uniref:hydroxyproline O-galactosyltransferase HPGT1-like isoform X3 n=1 Tax=Pistacia vera TaxID=55513 RepID=UPI001263CCD9|nr:hydroxyproline O-galactosyltransferase HPGT1-like isoform X3 [Pistacia vera]
MQSRGSSNRLSNSAFESRVAGLMLAMFASMATIYVASREQRKKLSALQMELAEARKEGFVSNHLPQKEDKNSKKRLLAVIGIITTFGRKKNRDAIRKAWMPTGATLRKLEVEKGIIVRFVVGRSANRGNVSDREIDDENRQNNDFIVLDGQVETPEERSRKIKSFFVHAVENWDAEFYAKVNDDVYVNIDALGAMLSLHLGEPRVYIGCMKSGPTNGMNQTGGNLVMEKDTFDMLQVTCLPFHELWDSLFQLTDLFFKHMHMMISVLDHGLLGLTCHMLMTGSFAAMPGHQEPYVQLCDLPCQLTCNIAGIFTEAILLSVMLNACLR